MHADYQCVIWKILISEITMDSQVDIQKKEFNMGGKKILSQLFLINLSLQHPLKKIWSSILSGMKFNMKKLLSHILKGFICIYTFYTYIWTHTHLRLSQCSHLHRLLPPLLQKHYLQLFWTYRQINSNIQQLHLKTNIRPVINMNKKIK